MAGPSGGVTIEKKGPIGFFGPLHMLDAARIADVPSARTPYRLATWVSAGGSAGGGAFRTRPITADRGMAPN